MKKMQLRKNGSERKPRRDMNETAGMNFVSIVGSVEMLRNPEFWR